MAPTPLTARPLDLVYFIFFATHIPATLLLDLQAIYPSQFVPELIAQLPRIYVAMTNDPIIAGAMSEGPAFLWLRSFMVLEAVFQLPCFILGMRGLLKDSKANYVLMFAYAASTATTLLPCLAILCTTAITSPETLAAKIHSISPSQRVLLLASYVPFLVVPLMMAVDMGLRMLRIIQVAARAETAAKSR